MKAVTVDGIVYMFALISADCSDSRYMRNGENENCGVIAVDLNGKKSPNTVGKDIFHFLINKYNVSPRGADGSSLSLTTQCDPAVKTSTLNGAGCAARAIKEGGIFYY